jgi:hypothetical protein
MNRIGTRNPMSPEHRERRTMVSNPDGAGTLLESTSFSTTSSRGKQRVRVRTV